MISRIGGGGTGNNGEGTFYIGESKNFEYFHTRKISKIVKNLWKIYNFLKIVKEFCNFWKFLKSFIDIFAKI